MACDGAVELLEALEEGDPGYASPSVGLDDICLLQFTSGTTGLPKGAMLSHGNQLYKSACQAQVYKYEPGDVVLTAMPIYHIAGMLWGLTTPVYAGATMVILSRFEARTMAAAISQLKCNKMYGTVSMNVDVMNLPDRASFDLTSHAHQSGHQLWHLPHRRGWPKNGLRSRAEASWWKRPTGSARPTPATPSAPWTSPGWAAWGIPHTGTDLRIMDFDDPNHDAGAGPGGARSRSKARPCSRAIGTARRPPPRCLRYGRLYTGDMGRFDEDGYVYFMGRKKEMIKASGYAIAP